MLCFKILEIKIKFVVYNGINNNVYNYDDKKIIGCKMLPCKLLVE